MILSLSLAANIAMAVALRSRQRDAATKTRLWRAALQLSKCGRPACKVIPIMGRVS